MAKANIGSVDDYIAAQLEAHRAILSRVRGVIRKALPKAEEVISYTIPAYKLDGKVVIYFAGWKAHYSIYPAGEKLAAAFKKELAPYKLSKGTIRFPLTEKVPSTLIARIAKFRAKEAAEKRTT